MQNITILKGTLQDVTPSELSRVITFEELKTWLRDGTIFKHIFQYHEAELLTYHIDVIPRPLIHHLILRLLARRKCFIKDDFGHSRKIRFRDLIWSTGRLIYQFFQKNQVLRKLDSEITDLDSEVLSQGSEPKIDVNRTPIYLRTDLYFGLRSGGSVGHVAGVLNNLNEFCGKPIFFSTDKIPTVHTDIKSYIIFPSENAFWDFKEIPSLNFNSFLEKRVQSSLRDTKVSFIYQRYSINNYTGVKLARFYGVPLVLEYNGSEIWMSRNWGSRLKYEYLSEKIELLNLKRADLIVVVSKPMQKELSERGIDKDKILVNPNGVDPDRYSPDIDGGVIRKKLGLTGKIVIGFIGTFGPWHGSEVLTEAFGRLLSSYPTYRENVRLLLIGEGVKLQEVRKLCKIYKLEDVCILTGLIPQAEGSFHLAACDILASPHVPNPDGSPFFGSPTKLFEYMAIGKGIVASNLDQIGEILRHDETAWLVTAGDPDAFKDGLKVLIDDVEKRNRLGKAARQDVVSRFTWQSHTERIIGKLRERCG